MPPSVHISFQVTQECHIFRTTVKYGGTLAQLRGFVLDFSECEENFPFESVAALWITPKNRL
jgi:hypothetical protein